jgi:hypothetical protein
MTGKDQVQFLLNFEKEYDTLIKTNPTSGAQVTWRAFMKEPNLMTREQYNKAARYTEVNTETDLDVLVSQANESYDSGDISVKDRDKILEILNRRKNFYNKTDS